MSGNSLLCFIQGLGPLGASDGQPPAEQAGGRALLAVLGGWATQNHEPSSGCCSENPSYMALSAHHSKTCVWSNAAKFRANAAENGDTQTLSHGTPL